MNHVAENGSRILGLVLDAYNASRRDDKLVDALLALKAQLPDGDDAAVLLLAAWLDTCFVVEGERP